MSKSFSLLSILFWMMSFNLAAINTAPLSDTYNGERGVCFNQTWKFHAGDASGAENSSFNDAGWRQLNLPHDWSIELSFNQNSSAGGGGGYLDGGIGWYRKSFLLPQTVSGKRITVQFEGIYMNSEVWINGHYLGIRPYGYSSFEYDLTPYVKFGTASNVIAVKVNNNQPNSRWYSGSGIYRNVWLTITDPVHVAYCGSYVTTPVVLESSATVKVSTQVQNHSNTDQVTSLVTTIYDKSGSTVAIAKSATVTIPQNKENIFSLNMTVTNPSLWSTDNPYLYTVKTQVFTGKKCTDVYVSKLGIRYYSFDANNGFSLNGKKMKIHGVCMHHDLGSLGAAQNYSALERQVEILKSFGCNGIRTSHNPPAPDLLEICDRLGLVVMDEVFDCWKQGKNTNDYHLFFDEWAHQDIKDWVRRDRNHSSVIMWSIGNEIPEQNNNTGVSIANDLMTWVRNEDNTRPVTQALNNQSILGSLLDIVGYNYAAGSTYDYDHKNHPAWKILGSETSSAVRTRGVYHFPVDQNILNSSDMQCSSYDNSVVSWGHSAENSWSFDRDRANVIGQFIWTGFDYIGEPTPYGWPAKSSYFGIVDMSGFPKDIYYFYQSQWTTVPMVHLLPHWNWSSDRTIPVWAYSNCDSVKLLLNGKNLGTKSNQVNNGTFHIQWNVPFEKGTVKAIAYKNGKEAATDSIRTSETSAAIQLKADRDTILANGTDLAFIETNILDKNGIFVPDAGNEITYTISGPGKIVGVDNGNPISLESFKANHRKAFNGKCLAIVQSTGAAGNIILTANSSPVLNNIALGKPSNSDSEDVFIRNNIAAGKSSSADSEERGNVASEGNDNNAGTRWCANDGNANHWWKVDLGAVFNLKGTQITWEHDGRVYQYKIEVSSDNSNWITVSDKTSNTSTQQIQNDYFTAAARYVRITVTGGTSNSNWASFYEFQVFDGTVTKVSEGNVASKGNDGDSVSRWSAADTLKNHWWSVDLQSSYTVKGTQVMWEHPRNAYQYKIEVSPDNVNWTLAADRTGNKEAVQIQKDDFTISGRYVKITITGGVNGANKASFMEFKVFDGSYTEFSPASVIIHAVNKPLINVDGNGWMQSDSVTACQGSSATFRPLLAGEKVWTWTGPNNFTSNSTEIKLDDVQLANSGTYTATLDTLSCKFKLNVKSFPGISSFINVNNTGLQGVDSVNVNKGDLVLISPRSTDDMQWIWTGPEQFIAGTREIKIENIQSSQSGIYSVQYIHTSGCSASKDIKVLVGESLGISNPLSESFQIYPNPVTNRKFTIILPYSDGGKMNIYDLNGEKKCGTLVESSIKTFDAFDLGLKAGTYLVKLNHYSSETVKKLIIQDYK